MSQSAFIWCDVCGKKIDEGEAAYVREKTDADLWDQLDREESADLEVWQCKSCMEEFESDD